MTKVRERAYQKVPAELSSRHGAETHALQIESYWHERGDTHVWARVKETPFVGKDGVVYSVETNLIGGLPPAR